MCGAPELRAAGTVNGYDFAECEICGFTFAPRITRERMERLYASGYHGPDDGAPEEGWADPAFLEPAFDHLPDERPLRVLDFGAGQSRVPAQLRERGHRVIAVDIAEPVKAHPDRLTGSLFELNLDAGGFDLVYAFQVFEHLPEPLPVLLELGRLTRPKGMLLIHTDMEVPDRESGFTDWWYVDPPDHCAFYRHKSFERALAETPHDIILRDPKAVLIRGGGDSPA